MNDGQADENSNSKVATTQEESTEIELEDESQEDSKEKKDEIDVEKLKVEVEQERKRAEEYLNRLKYMQADFENYQKRALKEKAEYIQFANERLLAKFLEVVDNLERAIEVGRNTKNEKALIDGVEFTLKNLKELLNAEDITPIEALGKPFNPTFHEAAETIETNDHPENTVVEELRKGYTLKKRVIRPSVVKVAKSPEKK
jgi:molecular chaperone GrpE